jgi:hypothetical protein
LSAVNWSISDGIDPIKRRLGKRLQIVARSESDRTNCIAFEDAQLCDFATNTNQMR